MPYQRPGLMFYTTATKVVNHGAPCVENGIAGVAVKQVEPPFGVGPGSNVARVQVAIGEKFALITKGIVQVPTVAAVAKGTPVYIQTADNVLTLTVGTNVKYGRVMELAGERGTPTGFMRVDLDKKDSF